MTILIAGCGFVGERAADLLHAAGHTVIGLTHSAASTERLRAAKPWRVEACDVSSEISVRELAAKIAPLKVDAFIHCASSSRGGAEMYQTVYVNGMRHLLAAFPGAFPLYTSSTSVLWWVGGGSGEWRRRWWIRMKVRARAPWRRWRS